MPENVLSRMRKLPTADLERIAKTDRGKVYIKGVGYVTLRAIQREIDRRREKAMEKVRAEL